MSLTIAAMRDIVGFPNVERLADAFCAAPQREKNGFSCFCQHASMALFHIGGTRPVPARAGGLSTAGERVPSFFVLKTPNVEVFPMSKPEKFYASYRSLPFSLALGDEADAINMARDITAFLALAVDSISLANEERGEPGLVYGDWQLGVNHCFSHVLDLLDIARGERKFPFADYSAPDLADVLRAGHAALRKGGSDD